MKRYLSYLLTLAVFAPVVVACTEEVQDTATPVQKHTVYFTSVEDATRTGLSIDGTTVNPNWIGTIKEDVHLFEMNGNSKVMGETQNLSIEEGSLVARFSAEFSGSATSGNTYGAVVAQMKDGGAFYIPATQNPSEGTLKDPAADFLVGYSRFAYDEPAGEDGRLVDLFFDRVAALSRIGFTSFKGGENEKVLQVKIKSATSMTGSATIDKITFGNPSTVDFTADEGAGVLTLNYGEGVGVPANGTFFAYFVSVPGTYKITGIEIQTDKYLYTKAPNANVTFTLTELKNLKVDLSTTTIPVESVSLNKTELALNVGATETLTAMVLPDLASNKAVTWSSSASGVATVDEAGKVTAIAAGTATITATTVDGGMTASCTVTVSDVIEYSLVINEGDKAINVGGTQEYTATLTTITNAGTPYAQTATETVTPIISSSNTTVATVSGNTATGVKSGEANISASYEIGGKTVNTTQSVKLTVNDVITYSLAINEGDKEINVGGTQAYTATLTTITNAGTDYEQTGTAEVTPTINSDNTTVATVSGNTATGVKSGEANISASYEIGGKTVNTTQSVKLTVNDVITYSLVINEGNKEINVGGTQEYTASLTTITNAGTPYEQTATAEVTPTISSDNTTVATVSGNTATGVKSGEANISASYKIDDETVVNTTTPVKLTVKDVITYDVTISPTSEDLPRVIIGNDLTFTLTLLTSTNGGNPDSTPISGDAATWATSASNVATVTDGVVTGIAEGTATITATYKDPNNEPHTLEVLIAVTKDPNHAGDVISVGTEEEL